jgi:hypothetical protein
MRKTLVFAVCIAAIVAFAGMVLAETSHPSVKASASAPMVNKKKAMGIIVSVDPVGYTLVMKVKSNDLYFSVAQDAKIIMSGKQCKLGDIKLDARATIFYTGGNKKRIAVEVIAQENVPGDNMGKARPISQ